MGLFDTVLVPCPKCVRRVEFQSKGGPCDLGEYTLGNAPAEVLVDACGYVKKCKCGYSFMLRPHVTVTIEESLDTACLVCGDSREEHGGMGHSHEFEKQ